MLRLIIEWGNRLILSLELLLIMINSGPIRLQSSIIIEVWGVGCSVCFVLIRWWWLSTIRVSLFVHLCCLGHLVIGLGSCVQGSHFFRQVSWLVAGRRYVLLLRRSRLLGSLVRGGTTWVGLRGCGNCLSLYLWSLVIIGQLLLLILWCLGLGILILLLLLLLWVKLRWLAWWTCNIFSSRGRVLLLLGYHFIC